MHAQFFKSAVPTACWMAAPLLLSLPSAALAQGVQVSQTGRLVGLNVATGDELGSSIDIDGDYAIVGSALDDDPSSSGSVNIFRRTPAGWVLEQKLVASDAASSDRFGTSVAIDGNWAAIGAEQEDPGSVGNAGSAYLFVRQGTTWTEVAKVSDPAAESNDNFGLTLDLDGDTLLVGIPNDDEPATNSGSACVFTRDQNGTPGDPLDDLWPLQVKLVPVDSESQALFGNSVAIDGDRLVVGARLDDAPGGSNSGAVYPYERMGSTWIAQTKLAAPDGAGGDEFGTALDLEGDRLIVSSPKDDDGGTSSGSIYVFEQFIGSWSFQTKIGVDQPAINEFVGDPLSLSGDRIIAGAPVSDVGGNNAGAVYVFEDAGFGTWNQIARTVGCGIRTSDEFGRAAAISGSTLVVGAPRHDAGGTNAGLALAFELVQGNFATYGFGDGSGAPCPCANESLAARGEGCLNSTGLGAHLSPLGSDSAGADDLEVRACNLPPATQVLLFAGSAQLPGMNPGAGVPFGDGLRVAGGVVRRLGFRVADPFGSATWGPGLSAQGSLAMGTTWHFQAWYRNAIASPCGTGFNLSSGLSVTFAP